MDHEAVSERLPWLLNGSLAADEEREVRAHVAGCEACREELERSGWHWEASRRHLPAEVLVAHVAGEAAGDLDAGDVEAHLQACPRCTELRSLVAEGARAVDPAVVPGRSEAPGRKSPGGWRTVAIAAGLIAAVGLVGWVRQEARIAGLRRDADELHRSLDARGAPRLNVPIFELVPSEDLRGAGRSKEIVLPAGADSVMLILPPGRVPEAVPLTLKVVAADGEVTWTGSGLVRSPMGDFTVSLPASVLTPGPMSLEIHGGDQVERYGMTVRHAVH